jgi:hypothetical protein
LIQRRLRKHIAVTKPGNCCAGPISRDRHAQSEAQYTTASTNKQNQAPLSVTRKPVVSGLSSSCGHLQKEQITQIGGIGSLDLPSNNACFCSTKFAASSTEKRLLTRQRRWSWRCNKTACEVVRTKGYGKVERLTVIQCGRIRGISYQISMLSSSDLDSREYMAVVDETTHAYVSYCLSFRPTTAGSKIQCHMN